MAVSATLMQSYLVRPMASSGFKRYSSVGIPAQSLRCKRAVHVRCQAEEKQTPAEEPTSATPKPKVSTKFSDVLAFSGPAPERINGRLAMIGFMAAVELARGDDLAAQLANGGLPWFVATAAVLCSVADPAVQRSERAVEVGGFDDGGCGVVERAVCDVRVGGLGFY
ncbi:uncharacterized protein A4U43_C03F5470 [Asparagus officinalis]|uniref:Uncharacterized protein n=1 Tax=Asparagus officinalis TaxID=4686 RepID=A0A5P1F8A5_ASPOF|nr:uncharacterized protein A4U43_C03F5470 [Asparagus officinalis]